MGDPSLRLDVCLLGEFRLAIEGRALPPAAWTHRRAAELVKLLALARGHRLTRDEAVESIFGHLAAEAGAAALHKAASHVRTITGERDLVVLRGGDVALLPSGVVSTDVEAFERAAKKALAEADPDACARAASLYVGELLPDDRYADWATAARRRLEMLHVDLLRRAGAWEEVAALDPTDERAHLALMRLYAKAGNRAAALRQFRRLREILAAELGIGPSPEAVALFAEIARGPAVHAPVLADRPMVGRQVELARALALLRSDKGATLLVRGDAGIGKTRFGEAVLSAARDEGVTTLRGGACREDGSAGFAPVLEALDRLLVARPDLAERLAAPARQVLARLRAGSFGESELGRQPVLAAVAKLLGVAAAERPVVLFLDDLHEADASTAELVHYLARMARFERVLILGAYRPEASAPFMKARAALVAQRGATEIDLAPLQRAECAALAGRILERPCSPAELDALYGRAAGNPFYLEVLAGSLAESGELAVPGALWDVLDAQVAAHGEDLAAALVRLAVLGDTFSTEAAMALLEESEASVFATLDRALASRLLEEVPGGYRFRHALVREAILRRAPAHRLRDLHAGAARALSAVGGAAAAIGRHLTRAGRADEAAGWLVQAARDEARAGAFASALELLDSVAEDTGEVEGKGAGQVDRLALRAELLLATGSPDAPSAFEEALRRARGRRRDALRVGKAQAHLAVGEVEPALSAMADLSPPEPAAERVRYLTARGMADWMRGDFAAVERVTREAMEHASRERLPRALAEAAVVRVTAAHMEGHVPARVSADLLDLTHSNEVAAAIHEGYLCGLEAYLYGGQPYDEVTSFAEKLRAAGERSGARRAVAVATCLLGETALLTGELDRAEGLLDEARRASLELRSNGAAALALQRLSEAALFRGDLDGANARAREALDLARTSPMGKRHLLQRVFGAKIRAAAPDRELALAAVAEAELAIRGPLETCFGCTITLAVPAAIACADGGDLPRARAYLAGAEQMARMFWRAGAWFAAVAEAKGATLAAEGASEEAARAYREAARRFGDAGQRLDAARCGRAAESLS